MPTIALMVSQNARAATTTASFNVQIVITDACVVNSTNDLDFGSHGVLNANTDVAGQVSVTCTTGTNYTVGLNGGNANAAPGARKMAKGSDVITYALYRNLSRTQLWGNTINTDTLAGTGTGAVQNFSVYARVPAQHTPGPGTYSDTVIVTLTY